MKRNKIILITGLIFILAAFFFLRAKIDFSIITEIEYFKATIISFGILAPVIYIFIMAIAIVVSPIPSMPLAAASGMVWGPYLGTLLSVIGAEIGAIISFLTARVLGRQIIKRMFKAEITFCDRYLEKNLTWIIFVSRLFPFFQFDIVSYGAGLTNMKLKNFAIATFFGMIPMTFIFTYLGKGIFINSFLTVSFSLLLIASMFFVPLLIRKYNPFGLKDKIKIDIK